MFIRTRRRTRLGRSFGSSDRGGVVTYHQAVESYRDESGRPRHRVLAAWNDRNDGPTVTDAIASCGRSIASLRGEVAYWRSAVASYRPEWHPNQYILPERHHLAVCERAAAKVEQRLAREEDRLLALRKVEQALGAP